MTPILPPDKLRERIRHLSARYVVLPDGPGENVYELTDEQLDQILPVIESYAEQLVTDALVAELASLLKYWNDLSMVVPALQASPAPVRQHIRDRIAQLTTVPDGI